MQEDDNKLPSDTPPNAGMIGAMNIKLPNKKNNPIEVFQSMIKRKVNQASTKFKASPLEDKTWSGSNEWVNNISF